MNILVNKTITDVPGILSCGIATGIKKDKKKDMCIIYSKYKANSAAVFTRNKVKAAPVLINMENIKNNNTQAIVINSGNANSCTGPNGLENANRMIEITANGLKLSTEEVLVASTGTLCKELPMDIIVPGIEKACGLLSDNGGYDAAEAILSTDTCTKTIAVEFEISGKKIIMAGMAKVLANGVAGNNSIDSEGNSYNEFLEALNVVNIELSKMIAKDGDGSTKFIEVNTINARNISDARICARSIVSSNLVKTAIFGEVIDWPRIACALGYSGIDINPDVYDISISNNVLELQIVKNATGISFDRKLAKTILSGDFIKIIVDLKNGESSAAAWGCDLTYDYVKANGYLE